MNVLDSKGDSEKIEAHCKNIERQKYKSQRVHTSSTKLMGPMLSHFSLC